METSKDLNFKIFRTGKTQRILYDTSTNLSTIILLVPCCCNPIVGYLTSSLDCTDPIMSLSVTQLADLVAFIVRTSARSDAPVLTNVRMLR